MSPVEHVSSSGTQIIGGSLVKLRYILVLLREIGFLTGRVFAGGVALEIGCLNPSLLAITGFRSTIGEVMDESDTLRI